MKRHVISVTGPFSLAHSAAFLAGFGSATGTSADGHVIRAAFPLDADWRTVGVRISQETPDGDVSLATVGGPSARQVAERVTRALALDVDARPLARIARADPVVRSLLAQRPGFRPIGFWSPYQAAVWSVLSQRTTTSHAAAVSAWMAAELGERITVDGVELRSFPAPAALAAIDAVPGVPAVKVPRLNALAVAAGEGVLDGARLRGLDADVARKELLELPGIGPFSADLILVRGAQHPDIAAVHEGPLLTEIARLYGLGPHATAARFSAVTDRWAPLRSWVSVLVRSAGSGR